MAGTSSRQVRYPPMVAPGNRPPAWAWPEDHAIHWCGEFEWKKGEPAREPDRPGEETDTGRGGDRQPGRESTEQPETEGGRMQTRMSLREVVEWMVDPGNAATLEDIEAEARRQLHGEDQEARQQAAIWCPDEEAEARLAGRITAVWARWFATVKAKGKHGQLARISHQ